MNQQKTIEELRQSYHANISKNRKSQTNENLNQILDLSTKFNDLQLTDQDLSQYKFVYSVPQIVDPDPITCIIKPTDDFGGLYLGSYQAASNVDLLKQIKIRAVLTASIETGLKYAEEVIHFHEIIEAHDNQDYNLTQHFDKAYDFIERNRKYTNVLIHCYLGISRSVTLVIAYLMRKQGLKLEKALWQIKAKRRQINPNLGFMRQLEEYEKKLAQKYVEQSQIKQYQQQQFNSLPIYNNGQFQLQQQQQNYANFKEINDGRQSIYNMKAYTQQTNYYNNASQAKMLIYVPQNGFSPSQVQQPLIIKNQSLYSPKK